MRLDAGQIEVVDDVMAEVLKSKRPAERIQIGFNIWRSAHNMLVASLSNRHPQWHLEEVRREAARRLLHGAL